MSDTESSPHSSSEFTTEQKERMRAASIDLIFGAIDALDTALVREEEQSLRDGQAADYLASIRNELEQENYDLFVIEPRRPGDFDLKDFKEGEHKGVMIRIRTDSGIRVNMAFYGGFVDPQDSTNRVSDVRTSYDRGNHDSVTQVASEATYYNLYIRKADDPQINVSMRNMSNARLDVTQATINNVQTRNNCVIPVSDKQYKDTGLKMHVSAARLSRDIPSA